MSLWDTKETLNTVMKWTRGYKVITFSSSKDIMLRRYVQRAKSFLKNRKRKLLWLKSRRYIKKKLHTLLCQGQSWGKESVHIHGKHMKAQKRREKSKKKFLEFCHIFLHYLYSKIDQISTKLQKFSSPILSPFSAEIPDYKL